MKISKLIKEYERGRTFLEDYEIERWKGRAEGKSTGLALRYLSEAISNPLRPVRVRDHHGTIRADQFLLQDIQGMVSKLGLDWVIVNRFDMTIKYDPYVEVERETVWRVK